MAILNKRSKKALRNTAMRVGAYAASRYLAQHRAAVMSVTGGILAATAAFYGARRAGWLG